MIAIAESGSTKCEWVIIDERSIEVARIRTQGFNPYFHSSELVKTKLLGTDEFSSFLSKIKEVYFYGAGCSSSELNEIIKVGLKGAFPNAKIHVDHDLLASAYSLYEGKPLVSCILGTGSNSCYYNGDELKQVNPALGFILGDEGGGAYFGKKLLNDFFYKKLPLEIYEDFNKTFNLDWEAARKNIYSNIFANVYLASFMPFIAKHKDNYYVKEMIKQGFARFIDVHVMSYPVSKDVQIGFVGSIASIFQDILEKELVKRELELYKIVRSPIDELVNYHIKQFESKISSNKSNSVQVN